MPEIALVIFDCDGVLIDSELLSAEVLLDALARIGIEIDLPYFFQNCLGRPFAAVAERITRDTGRPIGGDFETQFRSRLLERFESELKPIAGAREVLARLPIPFCVATSSSKERASRALEIAGFSDLVDGRLVSAAMVERGKPWPDLFLFAAERYGVSPSQCLVIEDSATGIEAARAANMTVWRFTGGCHFGVGQSLMTSRLSADKEFDDMTGFFKLLRG